VQGTDSSVTSGSGANANPRYVYLVQRLRGRQITMEEATELFTMMDGMVRVAEARMAAVLIASGRPAPATAPPPPKAAPPAAGPPEDLLWLTILGAGAGAGILAAIAKRASESMSGTPLATSSSSNSRPT
jgi:hypothetical protein